MRSFFTHARYLQLLYFLFSSARSTTYLKYAKVLISRKSFGQIVENVEKCTVANENERQSEDRKNSVLELGEKYSVST